MTADSAASASDEGRRRPAMTDVEPGQYTVILTAHGREMTQPVMVVPDRRRKVSDADSTLGEERTPS
jgi:hypothetical protein